MFRRKKSETRFVVGVRSNFDLIIPRSYSRIFSTLPSNPGDMALKKGQSVKLIRRLASRLPDRWQCELKRIYYSWQIRKGKFVTTEPEYGILSQFIEHGDWVIDVGANVGHYTKKFSDLVGDSGRVIAFEPVPKTFSLLSMNIQLFINNNITLFNSAVSDKFESFGISIPKTSSGEHNYYEAHLSPVWDNGLHVLAIPIDALAINHRIKLVKIDAEGHEEFVLNGMKLLLEKYHPVLIIETGNICIEQFLSTFGYTSERLPGSPNLLFR